MVKIGIIGLPNVGKSTLFKALTKKEVDISNYPFCTIEPNVGIVSVPDEKTQRLAELFHSERIVPAVIKFVDIAGLVKGANKGEGLGNQFLSHIKEVDAVTQVVRCFGAPEIIHTENNIDPLRDIGIVNTELILKDLETAEKRLGKLNKDLKSGGKETLKEYEILTKIQKALNGGELTIEYLKNNPFPQNEIDLIKQLNFLTAKPIIYVFNSADGKTPDSLSGELEKNESAYLIMNFKEELEASEFSSREKQELGIKEFGLPSLIKKSYEMLGLITFFTTGEDETKAWTVKTGVKAPQAAGVIHSDFEEKFIRANVIGYESLLQAGGWQQAREKGLIRSESKHYIVRNNDVIEFKI